MLINLGPEWKDRWVNPTHIISIRLDKDCDEIYIKLSDGEVLKCWINNVEFLAAEFERVLKLINSSDKKASEPQSQMCWISVEKLLPPLDELILCCNTTTEGVTVDIGRWSGGRGHNTNHISVDIGSGKYLLYNYWMRLVPFPKG